MSAKVRIIASVAIDGVEYSKGETRDVPDDIGNILFGLGAAVAADEATAARVRGMVEWTEAPVEGPKRQESNWATAAGWK